MIQAKIAARIGEIAPAVEENIITAVVDREVKKRADAVVQCLDKLQKLESAFKKIKPDQVAYDADGKVVTEAYSKEKLDERNKASQKIDKTTKAIDKALTNNDFGDVYNLASSGD